MVVGETEGSDLQYVDMCNALLSYRRLQPLTKSNRPALGTPPQTRRNGSNYSVRLCCMSHSRLSHRLDQAVNLAYAENPVCGRTIDMV